MKLINYTVNCDRQTLLDTLKNQSEVNRGVDFSSHKGTPFFKFKEKGSSIRITCEIQGGAVKDNQFLVGTYFTGRITEQGGTSTVRGVLLTAPIYHLILFALFSWFIVSCIVNKGFSVVPICLVIFNYFMFRDEYKKQGIIQRYILRTIRYIQK